MATDFRNKDQIIDYRAPGMILFKKNGQVITTIQGTHRALGRTGYLKWQIFDHEDNIVLDGSGPLSRARKFVFEMIQDGRLSTKPSMPKDSNE